jgi:GDP-L-fucose synthase
VSHDDLHSVARRQHGRRPDMITHAVGKVSGIQAGIHEPVAFLLENFDVGRNVVWT